jgi:hypothetical protein
MQTVDGRTTVPYPWFIAPCAIWIYPVEEELMGAWEPAEERRKMIKYQREHGPRYATDSDRPSVDSSLTIDWIWKSMYSEDVGNVTAVESMEKQA